MRVIRFLGPVILCASGLAKMTVTLAPSTPGPQRVGTPISWTAAVSGAQPGSVEFEFRGHKSTAPSRLLRAFHNTNHIAWAPAQAEGDYEIQVTARNRYTREAAVSKVSFTVRPNVIPDVSGGAPVITPTANPLVALFSAPSCPDGSSMFVSFTSGGTVSNTNPMACTLGSTMNFYIGGMLPATSYLMNYVVVTPLTPDSYTRSVGPAEEFTTGTIDPSLAFPNLQQLRSPDAKSSVAQGVLLLDFLSPPAGSYYFPTAVDLQGRTVWYYPDLGVAAQDTTYFIRPVPNSQGHMLLVANDPTSVPDRGQILREIDLAGNTVAETYVSQISEHLAAQGKLGITSFNHDAIRLPNGHTLVICSQERFYPAGTQGAPTTVDLVGDAIVDLDEDWNVAWSWSAYDYLDVNRPAVLGETCYGQAGCPELVLATKANDWLHANSLNYLPGSGDILLSIRHQDWVVKIDYADGNGTGNVLWRLGAGGDFAIQSSDPYPWFSHQHDAQIDPATNLFLAFDNGNTRIANAGGAGNSRGYVMQIDEVNLVATPILLADLGVNSVAVGSAQILDNGNYHFHAGFIPSPAAHALTFELLPDGTQNSTFEELDQVYRSYRMTSLYSVN